MAARKQLFHPDVVKQKIQTSQLLNRLHGHVFCTPDDADIAKKIMSDSQVRAALALLAKTVPDLKSVDDEGSAADTLNLVVRIGGDAHT